MSSNNILKNTTLPLMEHVDNINQITKDIHPTNQENETFLNQRIDGLINMLDGIRLHPEDDKIYEEELLHVFSAIQSDHIRNILKQKLEEQHSSAMALKRNKLITFIFLIVSSLIFKNNIMYRTISALIIRCICNKINQSATHIIIQMVCDMILSHIICSHIIWCFSYTIMQHDIFLPSRISPAVKLTPKLTLKLTPKLEIKLLRFKFKFFKQNNKNNKVVKFIPSLPTIRE